MSADRGIAFSTATVERLVTTLNLQAFARFREQSITMVRLLASEAGRPIYEKRGFQPGDEMVLTYAYRAASGSGGL